jgi:hypothetical protein
MINQRSLFALSQAQWTSQFKRPLYDTYAFTCIPSTVTKLLTGKGTRPLPVDTVGGRWDRYDCVILFVIDAFGWEFFEGFMHRYPFLEGFSQRGVASKISSEFPSTTAAHITSINTGLEVGETGIYEWFYYEPIIDRMIAPLLFSTAGDHESGTLLKEGFTPEQIFPFETIYQKLAKLGVRCIAMQQESIAHSAYSSALLAGAEIQPYSRFPTALKQLVELCQQPLDKPTYVFVYFGDIDSMGHRHGITSPKFADAVDYYWTAFETHFWNRLTHSPNRTAVIFTADHGMVPVHPKTTVYLNTLWPELETLVKKNRMGSPLVPAGSCRDFFLHLEEEHLEHAQLTLGKKLKGIADVVVTKDLLDAGFFGHKTPSRRIKERLGNLVVLPYFQESVFWKFPKRHFEQHFYAAHGGLTPHELESIFLFIPLETS